MYWCVVDDDNIKNHCFVWTRDPSKRSEPATEHGSFMSIMNEWYALSQQGTVSWIWMALNNNCGLEC